MQAPEFFTTAPSLAIPKAISNAGLEASQIDFYEINEAFAVSLCHTFSIIGLSIYELLIILCNLCRLWPLQIRNCLDLIL